MHSKIIASVFLALTSLVFADTTSHRKVAGELIDLATGPEMLRAGFVAGIDPMVSSLRAKGTPEQAIDEIKAAMMDWMEKEIIWDEMKPTFIDVYVREFSEDELKQLLAFYKTPVGRKALTKLPQLFTEGANIGKSYMATKQASLVARLQAIATKYNLK